MVVGSVVEASLGGFGGRVRVGSKRKGGEEVRSSSLDFGRGNAFLFGSDQTKRAQ